MPYAWGESWGASGGAWGESFGAADAGGGAVPASVASAQAGGRYWAREFRRRFKPKHEKISEEIQEVISDVAARQVVRLERDELKRLEELERELQLRGIEWESRYLTALNEEREFLINQEIGSLLRQKLENDQTALVLILSSIL